MRPRVWYLLSNTADAAGSRRCNPPAPHGHNTPNCATRGYQGPFLPVPRWWSAECVPWSSGIAHTCSFILDNKLPALFLLGATQNPFGKPPSNVWIQSKANKPPGGIADTVLRICFCLSVFTLAVSWLPRVPALFLCYRVNRGRVSAGFRNTTRSIFPTAHPQPWPLACPCFYMHRSDFSSWRTSSSLTALANFLTHFCTVLLLFSLAAVSFMKQGIQVNRRSVSTQQIQKPTHVTIRHIVPFWCTS